MPNGVDDKLDQVKQRFLENLSAEIPSLEKTLGEIKEDKIEEENIKHARMVTHKLAGSAKMFGFSELGVDAKKVELKLDIIIDKTEEPEDFKESLVKKYEDFLSQAKSLINKENPSSEDNIVTEDNDTEEEAETSSDKNATPEKEDDKDDGEETSSEKEGLPASELGKDVKGIKDGGIDRKAEVQPGSGEGDGKDDSSHEEHVANIKGRFIHKLETERPNVEKFHKKIKEEDLEKETLEHARMVMHKLAGSAKMFGFPELGTHAKKIELELDKLIDESKTIEEIKSDLEKAYDDFMEEFNAIHKAHPIPEEVEEKIEKEYGEVKPTPLPEDAKEDKKEDDESERESPTVDDKKEDVSEESGEEGKDQFNTENESYNILIIDDDDTILDVAEQIFTKQGCKVQRAEDGKKGLEILEKEKENETLPDIVILDVNMPNMNGFEVLEKIGEDSVLKTVPVIMLTGRTEDESVLASISSGALDYITKPFDPNSLMKTVFRILKRIHTKVLVVDDDELICELLEQRFHRIGYSVIKEYNGNDAWETIKEKKPDIVILDIMMPGMDGMSVLKHAKSDPETHDIPIIMLTAKNQNDNILKGLEGGAHDYVTKPFDVEEIAARVAGILRHRKKG